MLSRANPRPSAPKWGPWPSATLPFSWNTSGTDESGAAQGDFPDKQINSSDHLPHFNHMLTLGFGFYLPTEPKVSSVED